MQYAGVLHYPSWQQHPHSGGTPTTRLKCGHGPPTHIAADEELHGIGARDWIVVSTNAHIALHLWDHTVGDSHITPFIRNALQKSKRP